MLWHYCGSGQYAICISSKESPSVSQLVLKPDTLSVKRFHKTKLRMIRYSAKNSNVINTSKNCFSDWVSEMSTHHCEPVRDEYTSLWTCPRWVYITVNLSEMSTHHCEPVRDEYTSLWTCPRWVHITVNLSEMSTHHCEPVRDQYTSLWTCPRSVHITVYLSDISTHHCEPVRAQYTSLWTCPSSVHITVNPCIH